MNLKKQIELINKIYTCIFFSFDFSPYFPVFLYFLLILGSS